MSWERPNDCQVPQNSLTTELMSLYSDRSTLVYNIIFNKEFPLEACQSMTPGDCCANRTALLTDHWPLVTGHWSLFTDHWSPITDRWSLKMLCPQPCRHSISHCNSLPHDASAQHWCAINSMHCYIPVFHYRLATDCFHRAGWHDNLTSIYINIYLSIDRYRFDYRYTYTHSMYVNI